MDQGADGLTWTGLSDRALPLNEAVQWASLPDCGAVVTFCGTVRDSSEGRPAVTSLTYEAYEAVVGARLAALVENARLRFSSIRRVVLLHRVGTLEVGELAVVVVVAAPHRDHAFDAARYCIEDLKHTVPIWKREAWAGRSEWAVEDQALVGPSGANQRVESS